MGALRESLRFSGSHQGVHVPQGGGCALMNRSAKFQQIVRGVNEVTWALQDTPPLPPPNGSAVCSLSALVPTGAGCAFDCEDAHRCPGACEPSTPSAA